MIVSICNLKSAIYAQGINGVSELIQCFCSNASTSSVMKFGCFDANAQLNSINCLQQVRGMSGTMSPHFC